MLTVASVKFLRIDSPATREAPVTHALIATLNGVIDDLRLRRS